MAKSRFRVVGGPFGKQSVREATVVIDRDRGFFTVRPIRAHRTYELLLVDVAEMVYWSVLKAEMAEAKKAKKARKKAA